MFVAVVVPDPFAPGRFVTCRRNESGWTTAVSSHPNEQTAERERKTPQGEYDRMAARPVFDMNAPLQLVLGFYGPEQGDA